MKVLVSILALVVLSLPARASVASHPSCTVAPSVMGGLEATCTNPNSVTPTIMCVTMDGSTPSSNGHGTGCTAPSWALSPVAAGGLEYPGYFSLNQPVTVKIIAGVNGETDSSVVTYSPSSYNLPAPSVLAASFGWQCGQGSTRNCKNTNYWPSSADVPDTFRLWDTKTSWSELVPNRTCLTQTTNTCDWSILNGYLNALSQHLYNGTPRFAILTNGWVPCWAAGQPDGCGSGNAPNGTNMIPTDLNPLTGSPSFNLFMKTFVQYCTTNVLGQQVCVKDFVKGYEEWNEWNTGNYWTNCDSAGCAADLYEMWAPAAQIVRAYVPNAVLIAPSVTPINSNYISFFQTWMNLENTNGRISDVANWHLYLTNLTPLPYSNTPETQWNAVVPGILSAQSQVPGWNAAPYADTETNFHGNNTVQPTYSYACYSPLSTGGDYSTLDCEGQAIRWQILHASNGAASLDWYYGNSTLGLGYPTNDPGYATSYQNAQQYMIGGQFTQPAAAVPSNPTVWTAPFTEANGTAALWVWQTCSHGLSTCDTASYTLSGDYRDYRNPVDGTTTPIAPGTSSITVSVMPYMLEQVIAATPTFNPVGGTYTGPQTVTISTASNGAIICANTTGSPATNGTNGCAAGSTLVTGSFQVGNTKTQTTVTIYAVAGGTGYLDSPMSSAQYVINP